MDGSLRAAPSRDTVQLLDGPFRAWLAVQVLLGSNRPNSGRFFQRGSHRSLCSRATVQLLDGSLCAMPQLDTKSWTLHWCVVDTVQLLDGPGAWLKPSKTWTLYWTIPSVRGSHRPVIGRSLQCVARTIQLLDGSLCGCLLCDIPSVPSLQRATVQLLDGSLRAVPQLNTVQLLDAWLAPSKTWTLYRTVLSVRGSHCPVLDTRPNRPNSGHFFQRGSHHSLISRATVQLLDGSLSAVPQLSVAHTVQNLDAWLVLHGLVSTLHHLRLGYFVGGLHCPGPVHLLGWTSHFVCQGPGQSIEK